MIPLSNLDITNQATGLLRTRAVGTIDLLLRTHLLVDQTPLAHAEAIGQPPGNNTEQYLLAIRQLHAAVRAHHKDDLVCSPPIGQSLGNATSLTAQESCLVDVDLKLMTTSARVY